MCYMNILFRGFLYSSLSNHVGLIACFMSYKRMGAKRVSNTTRQPYVLMAWIEDAFATKGSHGEDHINYE